jgi:N-acetylmuramoyl-L-alanine amidase
VPADFRTILISVAHSAQASGAESPRDGNLPVFTEYNVSLRASLAAFRLLAGQVGVELFDVGPMATAQEYARAKIARVNQCRPSLALELHCNASLHPSANYSEVIYYKDSVTGKAAAESIANALKGLRAVVKSSARPNTTALDQKLFFFLEHTKVPALIVEGLFITNPTQAAFLSDGGAEAYGIAVAQGLLVWLQSTRGVS